VTVNVALVAPAATATLAGTVATAMFRLDRLTVIPPGGAIAVNVTVPVEGFPPTTAIGERETALRAAGFTVIDADVATDARVAVIVTVLTAVTPRLVTVKAAVRAPAGMVTLAGTVAAVVSELARPTTAPVPAALPSRLTVPVEVPPAGTVVGASEREVRLAGLTVITAFFVTPA
jgi:hypothetical protein